MAAATPESGTGTTTSASTGALDRQQPAQHFARLLHGAAEDDGIGARKIDVLEHAMGMVADRSVAFARHPFGTDDHHLAGLDVAQIDGVDQIEGAGFRGEHVAGAAAGQLHLAEGQRTESMRVARDEDPVSGQKHQRKRAFQLQQRFAERSGKRPLARPRDQMQNHFGIAGGLENGAVAFQFAAQFSGIGDVAVVRDRDVSFIAGDRKRLGIEQHRIAGGRIAGVADGGFAGQSSQHFRRENFGHVAHALVAINFAAVAGRDAGAFLPAMLERVEAQVG